MLLCMDLLSQHGRKVIDFPTEGIFIEQEGPVIWIAVSDTLIPPRKKKAIRVDIIINYWAHSVFVNIDKQVSINFIKVSASIFSKRI